MNKASRQAWKRRRRRSLKRILPAFVKGWTDAFHMPGVLALKWFGNLLFTVLAILLFGILLHNHLAHSAFNEIRFGKLRVDSVAEFTFANERELVLAFLPLFPVGVIYLFFNLYITGGILDRLRSGGTYSWAQFFKVCNRYLGKLLLIAVLVSVLLIVIVFLPHVAFLWGMRHLAERVSGPAPLFWATWFYFILLFFFMSFGLRVYDYARIALIFAPNRGTLQAFARGVVFPFRYGISSFLLWLALIVMPLLFLAAFVHLTVRFEPQSMSGLWLQFAFSQLIILIRIAGGVAALGAQMRFMQTLHG
jgi:hypothetical protein